MTDEMPPLPPPVPPGGPPIPPGPRYGQYAAPGPTSGFTPGSDPRHGGGHLPGGGPWQASAYPWVREPGIIPLRPMMLGDLFDGAVKAIRFNPRAILGMSFAVLVVAAVAQAVIDLALGYRSSPSFSEATSLVSVALSAVNPGSIAGIVAGEVLTGALIAVVADAVLGRRTTISQAWDRVRPRALSLLGFAALTGAIGLGSAVGALAMFDSALRSGASTGTLVALTGVLLVLFLVLLIGGFFLTMTPAVLVLERQGLVASMVRSARLIRRQFWRVLGVLALTQVLVGIVAAVLSAPLIAVVTAVAVTSGADPSDEMLIGFNAIAGLVSGILTTPFVTTMVSLLYVDCRIRNEGLDVTLMRQIQADESGR